VARGVRDRSGRRALPSYQNRRNPEEVEEERRLLYGAVTRVKEHLYLSYAIDIFDRATGMVLGKPSRFVEGFSSSVLGGMQVVEEEPEDPA
jgi:DNA helicase II / ATP-dependent DNA helicase PcrA